MGAPKLDTASPAIDKFGRVSATAALNLAAHLAYASVADPVLLGRTSAHTSIGDYAAVTRYLSPDGIAYFRSYIRDQNRNNKHQMIAAELAFANEHLAAGASRQAERTDGTKFDVPFSPRNYRATLNPVVGISPNGGAMTVTGSCSVQIPGTHRGKHVLVTLTRVTFTYYVQPKASKAYPVGVYGWESSSTAKYTALRP